MRTEYLELGDNEFETKCKVKFLKGGRGFGVFVNQTVQYSQLDGPSEHQAIKLLSHEQAEELRDFLIMSYPLEKSNGNN